MLTTEQKWQIKCYPKWLQKILYLRYRWLRVLLIVLSIVPFSIMVTITNTLYEVYLKFIDCCKHLYQDYKYILKVASRKGD